MNLGAAHVPVHALTAVTLHVPAAAVRKLQPVVLARLPQTDEVLAARPGVSRSTDAAIAVDLVDTGGTFSAGQRLTLIYVDATVRSGESWSALATKPVHAVHAQSSVVAWMRVTVVYILCAGGPLPAAFTDALEAVCSSDTRPSVLTRSSVTRAVLGCVAGAAAPTRGAAAEERVAVIQTRPAVTAGLRVALALT